MQPVLSIPQLAISIHYLTLQSLIEERWGDKVKEFKAIIAEKDKALEELRSRASELSRTVDAIENFKAPPETFSCQNFPV